VSTAWADRVGKQRLVGICLFATSVAYFILPMIARDSVLGTLGLVISFFFFEISVVAAIPLVSEAVPSARATLLSLNVGAFALGRTIGSFAGPLVYSAAGFTANGWVSAAAALAACALWIAFVRERTA
ncbi:MAG: MFS transporter, partial [Rudaea sp.]